MGGDRGAEGGGPQSRVRERLREFRIALSKYAHYSPEHVPRSRALKVEEAELTVIEELRRRLEEAVARGVSLDDVVGELKADGTLARMARVVSEKLGLNVDPQEAIADVESGRLDTQAGLVGFILYQAVARGFAEAMKGMGRRTRAAGATCPVCGATSDIMLVKAGSVSMLCPFCFYEWEVGGEIFCPYCGNRDRLSIGVFMDRLRRIGLAHCQACGSSWKVVMASDLLRAPRVIVPLIALAADKFRAYTPPAQDGGDAG